MRHRRYLGTGAACLLAASGGCGSPSDDLFVVKRTGAGPGAALALVVSDGGSVTCNGHRVRMSDQQLLDARKLQRDIEAPASRATVLRPGAQAVLTYSVRTPGGTVRFSDDSPGQPPAFLRLAALTRALAKGRCGLAR